jgi:di/tripeptidase
MALWLAQDSKPFATYASIERRSYQEKTQLEEKKQVVCQASYYDKDITIVLINRQENNSHKTMNIKSNCNEVQGKSEMYMQRWVLEFRI